MRTTITELEKKYPYKLIEHQHTNKKMNWKFLTLRNVLLGQDCLIKLIAKLITHLPLPPTINDRSLVHLRSITIRSSLGLNKLNKKGKWLPRFPCAFIFIAQDRTRRKELPVFLFGKVSLRTWSFSIINPTDLSGVEFGFLLVCRDHSQYVLCGNFIGAPQKEITATCRSVLFSVLSDQFRAVF